VCVTISYEKSCSKMLVKLTTAATNPDSPLRRLGHTDSTADVLSPRVSPIQRLERLDNIRHFVERKRQKHFYLGKVWLSSKKYWFTLCVQSVSRSGQAKFAFGVSIIGTSKITSLPQLPLKTMLDLKVVKIN